MNNHTPGPWHVGKGSWVYADAPVSGMNGSDAVDYYGGHMVAESIAPQNLALIAAAPALLALVTERDLGEHPADERRPCPCSQCDYARKRAEILTRLAK